MAKTLDRNEREMLEEINLASELCKRNHHYWMQAALELSIEDGWRPTPVRVARARVWGWLMDGLDEMRKKIREDDDGQKTEQGEGEGNP